MRPSTVNAVAGRVATDTRTTTAMVRSDTAASATSTTTRRRERRARARAGFRSPVLDVAAVGPLRVSHSSMCRRLTNI